MKQPIHKGIEKKEKPYKRWCDGCEYDGLNRVAKYMCPECGLGACKKCYEKYGAECLECPPPYLVKIK